MNRNVIISLTGLHYGGEDSETPIEVITFGKHYIKDGEHFLFYEEVPEDGTPVECRIRLNAEHLELNKHDAGKTHLLFLEGEEFLTEYPTPYGDISVGIMTHSLELTEEEDFLKAKLTYALDINNEKTSDCTLLVKVQSCEESSNGADVKKQS